ncbi:unnamed protein product [Calypogeia fissa]
MRCGCEREKVLHNATIYTTSTSNSTTTAGRDQKCGDDAKTPRERRWRGTRVMTDEQQRRGRECFDPTLELLLPIDFLSSTLLLLHFYDSVRLLAESSGESLAVSYVEGNGACGALREWGRPAPTASPSLAFNASGVRDENSALVTHFPPTPTPPSPGADRSCRISRASCHLGLSSRVV